LLLDGLFPLNKDEEDVDDIDLDEPNISSDEDKRLESWDTTPKTKKYR
jgi:hypothetical protein